MALPAALASFLLHATVGLVLAAPNTTTPVVVPVPAGLPSENVTGISSLGVPLDSSAFRWLPMDSDTAEAPGDGVVNESEVEWAEDSVPGVTLKGVWCPHSDRVNEPSKTCADSRNYRCDGCYLYRACHSGSWCNLLGYMIVPGTALSGMESINWGTAGSYDYLWSIAKGKCGSTSCVLITNPKHHRTQHQLHIHYRHYNSGGASMKRRLERALCGTSGWRSFSECGSAKARIYDYFPGVFSAAMEAYGGYGDLANVGLSVWFTAACGGYSQKTMILATTFCSIEHSISAR